MSLSGWTKFELTRDAIRRVPALSDAFARESAWKAFLVVEGEGRSPELSSAAMLSLIKVPALEGTEIWMVEAALQPQAERDAGFEKPSDPLASIAARELKGAQVYRPDDEDGENPIPLAMSEAR